LGDGKTSCQLNFGFRTWAMLQLWAAIKPLDVSGKWDLKANVELLKKKTLV